MRQTNPNRLGRAAQAIALVAVLTLLVIAFGVRAAQAGTYRATQCNSALGAGTGDFAFHRTSSHYAGHADCRGAGLTIRHVEGNKPTRAGRFGA